MLLDVTLALALVHRKLLDQAGRQVCTQSLMLVRGTHTWDPTIDACKGAMGSMEHLWVVTHGYSIAATGESRLAAAVSSEMIAVLLILLEQ